MDFSDFISQDNTDDRLDVEKAIGRLSEVEKAVLYLFISGHAQAEIGVIMGYSQQRIGQILANISKKGA